MLAKIHSDKVEQIAVDDLNPSPRNARVHPKKQIAQIAKSLDAFGFTNPLLIDDQNVILAGHGRLAAARKIGMQTVPCLRLNNLTAAEKKAYLIADNKLALNAEWDQEILSIELAEISGTEFDVSITGFEIGEVDMSIKDADMAHPESTIDTDDNCPPCETDPLKVVTFTGDVWILGRHRLLCGNAKSHSDMAILMQGDVADAIFTDPPYNVKIDGHVSGLGEIRHREFLEASGEMSRDQFTQFLEDSLDVAASKCRDGAISFVCMDWRHLGELLSAGHIVFDELKNICVWKKSNAGMGSFYRSQHELVLVWKKGSASHTNNFGLGDKGRYRTNVWEYAGVNSFGQDRMDELKLHPTVKPVTMVADAIMDVTKRGNIVLDSFGGSGTTLIAAERTGRSARMMELDPIYCDVIAQRWEAMTGKQAILEATGQTFERTTSFRSVWGTIKKEYGT